MTADRIVVLTCLALARFIQTNRTEIDRVINRVLGNEQPAHYLAYQHGNGCSCYGCTHNKGGFREIV